MNKKDFLKKISEKTHMTLKDSETFLNAFMGSIEDALSNGEEVSVAGFGKFGIKTIADRNAWNISTKELHIIPARSYPFFKFSPVIKNEVKKLAVTDDDNVETTDESVE